MNSKKISSAFISICLALSVIFSLPFSSNAASTKSLVGKNRFETATKISQDGWSKSKNVIILNSKAVSDAYSVAPLAKLLDAPVLLSNTNKLSSHTLNEIKRLGAENIYIIGGEASISKKIEEQLKVKGIHTERIGGDNREKTALAIAEKMSTLVPISEVIIINGTDGLADAASMIAVAAKLNIPIIFTNGNSNLNLSLSFINSHNINKSYIIGDSSTISSSIESLLPSPERISGSNRNDINAKILEKFYKDLYMNGVYIVKDGSLGEDQLIDASLISILAGKNGFPIITAGDKLSLEQYKFLNGKYFENIIQVGGNGNESVVENITSIIKDNKPEYITVPSSTSPNYVTTSPNYVTTSPNYVTTSPSHNSSSPNYVTTNPSHNSSTPNNILTPIETTTNPSYVNENSLSSIVDRFLFNLFN